MRHADELQERVRRSDGVGERRGIERVARHGGRARGQPALRARPRQSAHGVAPATKTCRGCMVAVHAYPMLSHRIPMRETISLPSWLAIALALLAAWSVL